MPWNLQFSGATPPPRPSCIDACCTRNVPTWVEMSCGISNPCIYQKPDNSDLFKGHWSACSWELMNWATVGGSSSGDIAQRWGVGSKVWGHHAKSLLTTLENNLFKLFATSCSSVITLPLSSMRINLFEELFLFLVLLFNAKICARLCV